MKFILRFFHEFKSSSFYQSLIKKLQDKGKAVIYSSRPSAWSWLITLLSLEEPLLVVLPTNESYLLSLELASWGKEVRVLSADNEDLENNLSVFFSENVNHGHIFLITPDVLTLSLTNESSPQVRFYKGMKFLREELINYLQEKGFKRTNIVTQPKEFAVRGYIFDIYDPGEVITLRLEFDENDIIRDIRKVNIESQLSFEKVPFYNLNVGRISNDNKISLKFHAIIPDHYKTVLLNKESVEDELGFSLDNFKVNWNIYLTSDKSSNYDLELFSEEPLSLKQTTEDTIIITEYVNRLPEIDTSKFSIIRGRLRSGFRLPEIKFNVLSDNELFDIKISTFPPPKKIVQPPKEFLEGFERGAPVVHINYGIGIFLGLKPVEIGGEVGEYIELEYNNNDRLYIPFNQLSQIKRYSGSDSYTLSSLNKTEWIKIREKAKEKASEVASKLLEIYALRKLNKGFSYSPNPLGLEEFIRGFPYTETPDQLKVMSEVIADMSSEKIMDRLICGDVGYGKTEIALRASYLAVMSGKQVAVLVPTTILAHQHYHLFKDRFAPFPINVGILSRFVSNKEQQEYLNKLKTGSLDIIIGTHRLLQKDLQFKDLGLLIIDEEHRFGVWQKEKIKEFKANLDTLSLSATPIPRTLQTALKGIKDISLIFTPPLGRLEAKIFSFPYNPLIVKEAIEREVKRGGQVFYVHNRIKSIYKVGDKLKSMLDSVHIGIAHGQMKDKELEEIMWKFYKGEIQVLLTTTIIESGIDIPRANTLIIDEAQNLGLSELYQLRGRVGRSNLRSYVYLFYNPASLTSQAEERLRAIVENTGLGSGFRLAMRDLEIRGAGNLYGQEQHGNIVKVGLDLFTEMIINSIKGVSGEEQELEDVSVSTNYHAYIPAFYINDEALRLYFYKKLSQCQTGEDIEKIKEELIDRFGQLPEELKNLIKVLKYKLIAKKAGAKKIIIKGKDVKMIFDRLINKEDIINLTDCVLIKGDTAYYYWDNLV